MNIANTDIPFQEFLKTEHFRIASVSTICDVDKFIKQDFANAIGHYPPKTILAIEEQLSSDTDKKPYYWVIAFVKWNSETKRTNLEPVADRLQAVRKDMSKISELKHVITEAKKIQRKLNIIQ